MNETSAIKCDKSEPEVSLLQWQENDWSRHWAHHSIVSLLERHLKSNLVTNLSLFASSTIYLYSQHWWQQQDDMYCRQNETCIICLEKIEHILHVWKHEDMSWNSFIIEYLKLNRKSLLEWQGKWVCYNDIKQHEVISWLNSSLKVSLLQWQVNSWSLNWARWTEDKLYWMQ